jgi:glycosyltransferase involved in cell wall biosynthesis
MTPKLPSIPYYVLPTLDLYNLERLAPNFLLITKILKKTNPDFVHLHTHHHYGLLLEMNRVPFILTSWGLEIFLLPHLSFLRRAMAKNVGLAARKITVDAECLRNMWGAMGIPEEKIEVIPFGVDPNLFNPNVDGRSVREELGVKEDDIIVISTRPLYNHHYNVECLVKAIPIVLKKHKNVKFIIKGVGPLKDYLRNLARNLKVYEHVRFVGLVPYGEIAKYLAASNIYVSTSFYDSTSVSLLEAMACGISPVTTDIPGNREWIQDECNGLLYKPQDHAALAERLIKLVEHEDLRKKFGETNRKIILERATWEKCVSKMEAVYQSIAHKQR